MAIYTKQGGVKKEAVYLYELSNSVKKQGMKAFQMVNGSKVLAWKFPSFTIILIPDTQNLVHIRISPEEWQAHFTTMADWIVGNVEALNIKMVIHLGDITFDGIIAEYDIASAALYKIWDAGIPMLLCIGNHDYDKWDPHRTRRGYEVYFNNYFGLNKLTEQSWFTNYGVYEEGQAHNLYCCIEIMGFNFLFLILEFGPRDGVLTWANGVVNNYPNHHVIVSTHSHLNRNGDLMQPDDPDFDYPPSKNVLECTDNTNDGVYVWEKFLQHHDNIVALHSAHLTSSYYLAGENVNGKLINQTQDNWQGIDEGGNGRVVVTEYSFADNTIYQYPYNPDTETAETEDGCGIDYNCPDRDSMDKEYPISSDYVA